jgi:hypothetical protein
MKTVLPILHTSHLSNRRISPFLALSSSFSAIYYPPPSPDTQLVTAISSFRSTFSPCRRKQGKIAKKHSSEESYHCSDEHHYYSDESYHYSEETITTVMKTITTVMKAITTMRKTITTVMKTITTVMKAITTVRKTITTMFFLSPHMETSYTQILTI